MSNAPENLDFHIKTHNIKDGRSPGEYEMPKIHDIGEFIFKPVENLKEEVLEQQEEEEDVAEEDLANEQLYQGKGLVIKLHQINNYQPKSTTTV